MCFFVVLWAEPDNIKRSAIIRVMCFCFSTTYKTWKFCENPFS